MRIRKKGLQTIIFTDLDGTLLDHESYSFAAARRALKKIYAARIPLVICSSKTRAEIEVWRKRLSNNDPFVSENGGGIFFPSEGVAPQENKFLHRDGYKIVELGMPYPELVARFHSLKGLFGEKIRGFSDMDFHEVARLTGLSSPDAELAMRREYTEPFIFDGNENEIEKLQKNVEALKLNLTRGGRFFHLLGDNDKGKAVCIVARVFKENFTRLKTIGLGDSHNDLPMLREVDIPILVQKPGGFYDERIPELPHLVRASGIGPQGWNSSLLEIL